MPGDGFTSSGNVRESRGFSEIMQCAFCSFTTADRSAMTRHIAPATRPSDCARAIAAMHAADDAIETFRRAYESEERPVPPPSEVEQGMPPTRVILRCAECSAVFHGPNANRALDEHMGRHRRVTYSCRYCGQRHLSAEANRMHEARCLSAPASHVRQEQIARIDQQHLDALRRERDRLLEEVRQLSDLEVRRRLYEANPPIFVTRAESNLELPPPGTLGERVVNGERRQHCAVCNAPYDLSRGWTCVHTQPAPCANCGKNHDDACTVKPPEERPRKIVL